jgi:hypothetical protein
VPALHRVSGAARGRGQDVTDRGELRTALPTPASFNVRPPVKAGLSTCTRADLLIY